jgi:hypothetical protein
MTPDERQLITDLFERMRAHGAPEKDRDAEQLINQQVRANPDAAYMLVQSVLVQEQALEAANSRVLELEEQVRRMEEGERPRSERAGGFLGGFWGNSARREEAPRSASVPQVGGRATPSAYAGTSAPWSQSPPPAQPQAPSGGGVGSFMRTALGTAAGVAGGVLLADSIRNMLGGGAHASPARSDTPPEETEYIDERDNDPGTYDASYDESNDPGFDSGSGDIEI